MKEKIREKKPNGYGCVTKLSGRRNKPWVFKFTKDIVDGKQIQKAITFRTKEEALDCQRMYILKHNKNIEEENLKKLNPQIFESIESIETDVPTVKEVFDIVYGVKFKSVSESRKTNVLSAFKKLKSIESYRVSKLDRILAQSILERLKDEGYNYGTVYNVKLIISNIVKYAFLKGYINDNFTRLLDSRIIDKDKVSDSYKHLPAAIFTHEEITKLWELDEPMAKVILTLIYTGCRRSEITEIQVEIHKEDKPYIITGIKTENGKNRVVPIHKDIEGIFEEALQYAYKTPHTTFDKRFKKICNMIGKTHKPHDTRHTFATITAEGNMSDLVRSIILGHSQRTLVNKVYTHFEPSFLYDELNKIKF